MDWKDYVFPGGKFSVFIQTPDSESALSSSRIGSKSLRSVGADVGNAEAVTRPEVGRPEIEAREGLLENPALFSFFGEDPASDVFEFSSFSVCELESLASPIGSNNQSIYETLCNIILAVIYI